MSQANITGLETEQKLQLGDHVVSGFINVFEENGQRLLRARGSLLEAFFYPLRLGQHLITLNIFRRSFVLWFPLIFLWRLK